MRASRLLATMIMLQGKGRLTAQELADRFEVSKRTIYRDLDELAAAGVPILTERGVGGGIALKASYKSSFTQLTPKEAAAFSLSGLPELASHLGVAAAAAGARAKILNSLGEQAEVMASRFFLDPVEWYGRITMPDNLRQIAEAVLETRTIEVDYQSWSKRSVRRLDPLGLVVKSGEWYMLARMDTHTSIYRLEKVLAVRPTEHHFRWPHEFDLGKEWRSKVTEFETRLFNATAQVLVHPEAMSRIGRLGALTQSVIIHAEPDEHGRRCVTIPIESPENFVCEVLAFAGSLEIEAPEELRTLLRKIVEKISRQLADRAFNREAGYTDSI